MKPKNKKPFTSFDAGSWESSETVADEILAINLRPVDEANVVVRPDALDRFYVEELVAKKAEAQPLLWDAAGEAAAREPEAEAAELGTAATVAEHVTAEQREIAKAARDLYELAARVLGPCTRRPAGEKLPYYLRFVAILGGDVAGVAGAAILLGETVTLGLLQGISSGTAAVTSGLIAHEVKDSRLARKRQKPIEDLTQDERRFAHLFQGGDSGERIAKWVVGGALLIGTCIAGSIFALRTTTEGSTAGWAFGLLAAAVALASWANVYHYTDEAADLIDARRSDSQREAKRLVTLSHDKSIARRARAAAEAISIRAEFSKRGLAAAKDVEAFGNQLLHENPGVAGHGWGKPQQRVSRQTVRASGGLKHTVTYEPPLEVTPGTNHDNGNHEVEA